MLLDQFTLQSLESKLVYDQNFFKLHTEVKKLEDSHILKQYSLLLIKSYCGFPLKSNKLAADFEETLLIELAFVFVPVHMYDVMHSILEHL